MGNPIQSAIDIDGIKHCNLRYGYNGLLHGTAYHADTGIEFDVRQRPIIGWYASDDEGRKFYGITLAGALKSAIKANR